MSLYFQAHLLFEEPLPLHQRANENLVLVVTKTALVRGFEVLDERAKYVAKAFLHMSQIRVFFCQGPNRIKHTQVTLPELYGPAACCPLPHILPHDILHELQDAGSLGLLC